MSFIDNKKQEIDPKIVLKLMPELKEDHLQDHPCKLEEGSIELWKVENVLIGDSDLPIEKQCFSCTQVLFDKEEDYKYLELCEKTMQGQTTAFDQQLDTIHKLDCTIVDEDGNREVKPLFLLIDSKIYHGNKLQTFN
jgi:hypothetical protein